jgi:hypothetical protein
MERGELMNKYFCILGIALAILMFSSFTYACNVSITNFDLKLRGDSVNYLNNITVFDGEYIDIKLDATIGTVQNSTYNCNSTATISIDIYQYNGSTYTYWFSTPSQTINLQNGQDRTYTWNNAFEINDSYERYQVRARITDGTTTFSTQTSTIYVIQETTQNDSTPQEVCNKLNITANDITISENSEKTHNLYITNDSTKRFEILDIETSNNGVNITTKFFEKYAFSGEVADIILNIASPGVSSNKVYENYVKVRGIFSDGIECSYNAIGTKNFNVNINNVIGFNSATCSNLIIDVPDRISIQNYGNIPFTITNNTGKRADIVFESELDITPTIISLPENTAISREVSVTIAGDEAIIWVKPIVEGCNYSSQKIIVENSARGSLSAVTMSVTPRDTEEGKRLIIEFNNPTNKSFQGQLSFELPNGWNAESRIITVAPGKTIAEVLMSAEENAKAGTATVRFASNGEEITQTTGTQDVALIAGLFAFGEGFALGLIFIVVLVLIGLLLIQADKYRSVEEENEVIKWETEV